MEIDRVGSYRVGGYRVASYRVGFGRVEIDLIPETREIRYVYNVSHPKDSFWIFYIVTFTEIYYVYYIIYACNIYSLYICIYIPYMFSNQASIYEEDIFLITNKLHPFEAIKNISGLTFKITRIYIFPHIYICILTSNAVTSM